MTTQTTGELARLQTLAAAGMLSDSEKERYRQLLEQQSQNQTPGPVPAYTAPAALPSQDGDEFIPCNVESFKRGGQSFVAPPQEGVYPGVFTGTIRPDSVRQADQLWFLFESKEGANPAWRGSLVTAALTTSGEKSGAFKLKEILDALDIPYNLSERGVMVVGGVKRYVGRQAQVSWEQVDIGGKRELRIQRVLGAKAPPVQQAV